MTAQAITARLRALARQVAGRTVYRPTKPVALFVCDRAPEAPSGDWEFFSRNGQWYYNPSAALLRREGLLPAPAAFRESEIPADDAGAVLHTCAVRCLKETAEEQDTELIVLCLYYLSFGERETLARALPRVIARRLRQKQPLSRAAGTLIQTYLNEKA